MGGRAAEPAGGGTADGVPGPGGRGHQRREVPPPVVPSGAEIREQAATGLVPRGGRLENRRGATRSLD